MPLITEPGLYDLDMATYHSDCCEGPSISSSGLRQIMEDGPAAYWRNSPLNPDRVAQPVKTHFSIGTAAHTYLLEPQKLLAEIAVYPADILAKNGAASTTAAKSFFADAMEEGKKVVLKPEEWDMISAMRDALANHPHARRALIAGRTESSMIWKDKATGVWIKARPDFMPKESGQYITDFKTAESLNMWNKRAVADGRLDIQAALQIWGAHAVCEIEPLGVMYIVQSKQPGHDVAMLPFTLRDEKTRAVIDAARLDLRRAIEAFATCWETKSWPTGWEIPREIRMPGWRQNQIEKQLEGTEYEFVNEYDC